MKKSLGIGIIGLGTVGCGTVKILQDNAGLLQKRSGVALEIKSVSARTKRKRPVSLEAYTWHDNPLDVAKDPEVDIFVELVGGDEGIAYDACKLALASGKHVVTANKALIAKHGAEFATIAQDKNVALAFEPAVAGGIPIIKGLKEGLSANKISKVAGIMNGTCNYILTTMQKTGRHFDDVLQEAQDLGYAEADPSFDIDGVDTAHKLAILVAIAFGVKPDFSALHIEGIRGLAIEDITYAGELGYLVKLLGIGEEEKGTIKQFVYPALVKKDSSLAKIDGANNAVAVQGDHVGEVVFEGPGAGAGATASAVVADIMDIASGRQNYPFAMPVEDLSALHNVAIAENEGEFYIRVTVKDEPGVLASVTDIFSHQQVSIESVMQKNRAGNVDVVLVTHVAKEATMREALKEVQALEHVLEDAVLIRIN